SRFKEYAHRGPNNIFQRYGNYYGALPALQPLLKQMFRKNYDNREKIKEALIQFYRHPWIKPRDPFRNSKVKMVVHFGDGEKVVLESDRLRLFKIPWTVHRQGEARFSYDPRITFAFLDLIDLSAQKFSEPEKDELVAFELHGLLKQVDYFDVLGAVVKQSVYSDRDAENLRAHYPEIEQAMVKNYRLLWADKDISGMKARWQRNVGPVPVFLHLKRSPYKGDKFLLQKFESRIGPAVDRLIQIPWLQEALKREPGSTAFIQIDERHTYKFPRPRLNQALRLLQVKAMAPHLTNELSDTLMISLVHQTDEFRTPLKYSDWLVLPDGRMLLYRTNMERLYQWDLSAYRTQFYLGYELPPFLALVSPEGKMSILRQQPKTMEARQ
ncbi:MAG: hypothetical protein GWM98_00770, partial [Nitrospinaceae bacterium]|nr:hypothetical protein [Nitrospinaceae bacterium]NIR53312.1 hypothetical protein [Nitrospinaceae bacterium]NIS83710.1 hypothetical protein [Nitrospinaceae bacterium]NIT80506.1 hypothetical protein [Nitrospinaceae bacterium]NIU42834.1 hypothetical protein [Nitrospinaceae bacterium]